MPSWSVSRREALASSKCQGGRVRTARAGCARAPLPLTPSASSSSAGFRRSSSAASALAALALQHA